MKEMKELSNMTLTREIKRTFETITACLGIALFLIACASSQGVAPVADTASRIDSCKSTDQEVASAAQCLQDGAACYQISNGSWCTGTRGDTCPAGSIPLAAGESCPPNRRCFRAAESLECMI
ncbi:MAG: hypothetical protein KTR32_18080 [Granulosicoccus sp.]|nr:hypothetical protein [Granulosicoccus sp.]